MAVASIVARLSAQVSEFQRSFDDATRTTTQFEKKFAGVASDVTAQQQRLNKAFSSFSGDNLIRDANAMAAAITKVGGASKLTAVEQTRVNQTVTEALAKYTALGQAAPAALTQLAEETKRVAISTQTLEERMKAVGSTLKSVGSGMKSVGIGLSAAVTVPLVAAGAAIVKLGIDAVESENLVAVSFGTMKADADAWSKGLSKSLGLNEFELRKQAGTLFNMTTSMGLTKESAFGLSTGITKLAADMASFRNISIEEATTKLRAGLVGETEPLKAIGILVDEATVKTFAYTNGIAKQGAELTQQQKVLARYGAILKQTGNDQGDLARTIDSPSNQLRIMQTRITEAATALGVAFIPAISKVTGALSAVVPYIQTAVNWFIKLPTSVQVAAVGVLALSAAAGPVLIVLGSLASSIGSLLPIIAKMGLTATTSATGVGTLGTASATSAIGVTTLKGALAGLASLTGVAIALTGIAFGIYKIIEAIDAFNKSDLSFFEFISQKQDDTALRRVLGLTDQTTAGFNRAHAAAKDFNLELEKAQAPNLAPSLTPFQDALASARKELDDLKKSSPIKFADILKGAQSGQFDMTALKAQSGLSEEALKLLQQQLQGTKHEMSEAAKAAKELAQAQADMVAAAIPLTAAQKSTVLANEAINFSHEKTAKILGVNVAAITTYVENVKNAEAIDAMWVKTREEFAEGAKKVQAALTQAWRAEADASAANLAKQLTDRQKYQSRVDDLGLSGRQLELKHIDDARTAELQSLGQRTVQNARFWDQNKKLIDAYYAHQTKLAKGTPDTLVERMANQGVQTKAVLQDLANAAKRDYEQMKASGLFTYQQLAEAAARSGAAQKAAIGKVTSAWTTAFQGLLRDLPAALASGFQQGGLLGAVAAGAGSAADKFQEVFAAGMARTGNVFKDLKFNEKLAGFGAAAATSFVSGFETGLQNPGAVGALSAVASGFAAGFVVGGPWLGFATATISLVSNLIGSFKNARMEAAALRVEIGKLETQFHGRAELTKVADRAGFSLPTRSETLGGRPATAQESVEAIFNSGNAADFNKRITALNKSLDEYNEKLKAIASATDAVNARTAIFAKQFAAPLAVKAKAVDSGDTTAAATASQQIQEIAQRTQPEFERLGIIVKDTFGAMVKESGNAIAAITALGPSFQVLKSGITDFGLTSTGVIDTLVASFDLVNDAALKPFFENIQADGQILKGLFDAKALSPEGFQALAADIGQSIQEVVNRGGDMAKTLALSQPVLQTLWEAQQTYGQATDQTTQSILDQATQQGLVGAKFKDTNEKILDILFEINKVLGGAIPASMAALPGVAATAGAGIQAGLGAGVDGAARNMDTRLGASLSSLGPKAELAAKGIGTELGKIKVPDIKIRAKVNVDDPDPVDVRVNWKIDPLTHDWQFGGAITPLATGGVVRRPTLALVGESGPEAVIPLSQMSSLRSRATGSSGSGSAGGPVTVNIYGDVDSDARAERVAEDVAKIVRRGGRHRTLVRDALGVS